LLKLLFQGVKEQGKALHVGIGKDDLPAQVQGLINTVLEIVKRDIPAVRRSGIKVNHGVFLVTAAVRDSHDIIAALGDGINLVPLLQVFVG